MIVTCSCGKDFEIDLKTRTIQADIEEIYFICPHCKTEHSVTKTNQKIRGLQQRIEMLTYRAAIQKDNRIKRRLLDELRAITNEKKTLMEHLNRA